MARNITIRLGVQGVDQAGRQFRELGDKASRGIKQAERASASASKEGIRLQAVFRDVSNTAGRLKTALAGIDVGIGIAGIVRGFNSVIDAGAKLEEQQRTIQQLLRTTGGVSGQTFETINRLARELGESTLASTQGVRAAAAQLLTFRSIAGDTFEDTLRLAQDLAAVGMGTLESATKQLGKALEDPIRGLSSLREVGVSFTDQQVEVIKAMVETGRQAEAQREILKTLQAQVGGAGEAQASGLTGAFDTLNEEIGRFLENVAEDGLVDRFTAALGRMADAVGAANEALFPDVDTQLSDLNNQIREAQELLAQQQQFLRDAVERGNTERAEFLRGAIADQKSEIEALQKESQALFKAEQERKKAAEETAKASKKAAEALAEQTGATEDTAEATEKLTELEKRAAEARELVAEARRQNFDRALRSRAEALAENEREAEEAARRAAERAAEEQRRARENLEREAQRAAQAQAQALLAPFEAASERVAAALADPFAPIFTDEAEA